MIITYPKINPDGDKITKEIMDNKVLLYFVVVLDEYIEAKGQVVTIRQMLDVFIYDRKPKTVGELVKKYTEGYAFHPPSGTDYREMTDRELREAVFDQEIGSKRNCRLTELLNDCASDKDRREEQAFSSFATAMLDSLLHKLPETAPYAEELADV